MVAKFKQKAIIALLRFLDYNVAFSQKGRAMKAVLTLENPSDELLKAFKSMAKVANVKCKLQHKAKMPAWLKEAKEMSQKPHTYKAYDNVDEMFEDILK